jgi:hypothetical protein
MVESIISTIENELQHFTRLVLPDVHNMFVGLKCYIVNYLK